MSAFTLSSKLHNSRLSTVLAGISIATVMTVAGQAHAADESVASAVVAITDVSPVVAIQKIDVSNIQLQTGIDFTPFNNHSKVSKHQKASAEKVQPVFSMHDKQYNLYENRDSQGHPNNQFVFRLDAQATPDLGTDPIVTDGTLEPGPNGTVKAQINVAHPMAGIDFAQFNETTSIKGTNVVASVSANVITEHYFDPTLRKSLKPRIIKMGQVTVADALSSINLAMTAKPKAERPLPGIFRIPFHAAESVASRVGGVVEKSFHLVTAPVRVAYKYINPSYFQIKVIPSESTKTEQVAWFTVDNAAPILNRGPNYATNPFTSDVKVIARDIRASYIHKKVGPALPETIELAAANPESFASPKQKAVQLAAAAPAVDASATEKEIALAGAASSHPTALAFTLPPIGLKTFPSVTDGLSHEPRIVAPKIQIAGIDLSKLPDVNKPAADTDLTSLKPQSDYHLANYKVDGRDISAKAPDYMLPLSINLSKYTPPARSTLDDVVFKPSNIAANDVPTSSLTGTLNEPRNTVLAKYFDAQPNQLSKFTSGFMAQFDTSKIATQNGTITTALGEQVDVRIARLSQPSNRMQQIVEATSKMVGSFRTNTGAQSESAAYPSASYLTDISFTGATTASEGEAATVAQSLPQGALGETLPLFAIKSTPSIRAAVRQVFETQLALNNSDPDTTAPVSSKTLAKAANGNLGHAVRHYVKPFAPKGNALNLERNNQPSIPTAPYAVMQASNGSKATLGKGPLNLRGTISPATASSTSDSTIAVAPLAPPKPPAPTIRHEVDEKALAQAQQIEMVLEIIGTAGVLIGFKMAASAIGNGLKQAKAQADKLAKIAAQKIEDMKIVALIRKNNPTHTKDKTDAELLDLHRNIQEIQARELAQRRHAFGLDLHPDTHGEATDTFNNADAQMGSDYTSGPARFSRPLNGRPLAPDGRPYN